MLLISARPIAYQTVFFFICLEYETNLERTVVEAKMQTTHEEMAANGMFFFLSFLRRYVFIYGVLTAQCLMRCYNCLGVGLPAQWRDFCAHKLIPLNKCRRKNFYMPFRCEDERHDYEKCQYDQ